MIRLWEKEIPGFMSELNGEIPCMVPYLLKTANKNGAVIVVPGGGYEHRAPHEAEPVALWLNSIGLSAFVLHYRVAPYRHPYPMLDAQRAIRLVRYNAEKWNVDSEKIGILGFSAGGHLASTVGTHFDEGDENSEDPVDRMSSRPDAMILCYPVISFGDYRHDGSMINLIGPNPPEDLRISLSNEMHVSGNTPPTFLWHTADDAGVPVENSLMFASALSRHKVDYELHVFPSGAHGLGLAESHPVVSAWTGLCEKWLISIGFLKQPQDVDYVDY